MPTSATLTDELLSQLQGPPLQQLAQQLGSNPAQTQEAVSAALPLMFGAMGQNAGQPQGAAALLGALQRDHGGQGPDLGALLGGLLGGWASGSGVAVNAGGILGHIFGSKQSQVEAGLGEATGMARSQSSDLLQLLAPIVMSFLAQRVQSGQIDAGGLGNMLGQEREQVKQQGGIGGGLLGSLLDQDGDGELGAGDLLKLGAGFLNRGR